ncbi:MAG TPA: hypothetical protein VGC97_04805 [Pyrinomonadaceae bacterium]
MRLIMVAAPEGAGDAITKVAFSVEIDKISRRQVESHYADGRVERKDVVDMETSTPKGKRFVDALLASDFYDRDDFTISIRQPRSIVSKTPLHELTKPFVEPATDVFEELWQFSHITASFIGRVAVASCLIAYGMIEQKLLLMIAGLFVLPLVPLLLGVSFGTRTGIWKLVGQSALAFLVVTVILFLGGAAVAALAAPPLKYNEFNSLPTSFIISVGVAVAAVLANIDDAGQRQLIGLAATAQIALIPVWFGISAVFGFPAAASQSEIVRHGAVFFVNIATMLVVTFIVYTLTKAASPELKKTQTE